MRTAAEGAWLGSKLKFLDPIATTTAKYTGEDVKYIPFFFVVLSVTYWVAYVFMQKIKGISNVKRATLASCVASTVHGTVTSIGAGWMLWSALPFHFDAIGTPDANVLLQFSTAYMIHDFVNFLLPFTPTDYLFVVHHIITGLYMTQTLVLHRAQYSALVWVFMGEVTGPLLNAWTVAKELRTTSKVALRVYEMLSPLFTLTYILTRTVLALPVWSVWLWHILYDCAQVDLSYRVLWCVLVSIGVWGSQIWSYKLITGFIRKSSKKSKKQ